MRGRGSSQRIRGLAGTLLAATLLFGRSGFAAEVLQLDFATHASFFFRETKQATPLDPHVFVRDPSAPQGVGPRSSP